MTTDHIVKSYDAELARRLGADDYGMRSYVLVILKTGPTRVPDGDARKAMFAGHFANMKRLSEADRRPARMPHDSMPLPVVATGSAACVGCKRDWS